MIADGSDRAGPGKWRITLGQVMMLIVCGAVFSAALISQEGNLLPMIAFYLLISLLARIIIYSPLKELLFGPGLKDGGGDAERSADGLGQSEFEEVLREGSNLAPVQRDSEGGTAARCEHRSRDR